jgi:S1-C subfamily serine protease
MTVVDGVITLLILLMALQGYARGFIVGVAALVGFIGGAVIGSRVGPLVLSQGAKSPYAPLFGLGGAMILGGLFGAVFEGVARRVRRFVWLPGLRLIDGLLGAVLTACVGLGLAWIVGAAALQTADQIQLPVNIRRDIERSVILRHLNGALPPSGPILNALGRVDPLSSVQGRVADVPAPTRAILRYAAVRAARRSVVRVLGDACGLGVEGSGWIAGPGLVVTNAHVVAGEKDTTVELDGDEPQLPAQVLVFDPHNDVAVLSVPGLNAPALTLASGPASGTAAAILGYPLDGRFDRQAGRLGQTQVIATDNAYDDPTVRAVTSLRGLVRPGNSGGPMIDAAGQVVATVFAEITDTPAGAPGGLAIPDSVVTRELARARTARVVVGTQGCAD